MIGRVLEVWRVWYNDGVLSQRPIQTLHADQILHDLSRDRGNIHRRTMVNGHFVLFSSLTMMMADILYAGLFYSAAIMISLHDHELQNERNYTDSYVFSQIGVTRFPEDEKSK